MSTNTDNLQLRKKASHSIRQIASFKRSLLKLGGLSKLQRRSITALVQQFWNENACELLGTTSNYTNNEDISAHNGTQMPQLTNTDGKSTELDQRCLKEDKLIEYNEIVQYSLSTTSDSSDTDTSNMEFVTPNKNIANGDEPYLLNRGPEHKRNNSNKFSMLEDLDTETPDTDTETTDNEEIMDCSDTDRRDSRIRELEQIKCDNEHTIKDLECSLNLCRTNLETNEQRLKLSEQKVRTYENQIIAHSTEQHRKADKTPIDDAIRRHFYRILNDTIESKVEYRWRDEQSFVMSLSFLGEDKDQRTKFNIKTTKEIFSNEQAELIKAIKDLYLEKSLVPISSIRKVNEVEEFDYELYLEKVLAKHVRACARDRGF